MVLFRWRYIFYNVVEEGYLKLYEFHFNEEDITKTYFFLIFTNEYTGSPIKLEENKYLIEYSSFTFPNVIEILQTEETSKILTCNFIVNLNKEKLKIMYLMNLNLFIINFWWKTVIQCFILKPVDLDENNKYPLAFLIHGRPEEA